MDQLADVVKQVVFGYAGSSPVVCTFKLADEEQGFCAVNIIDWPEKHRPAGVVVLPASKAIR